MRLRGFLFDFIFISPDDLAGDDSAHLVIEMHEERGQDNRGRSLVGGNAG